MFFFFFILAVKDPPYVVKESGYAGFELDIDIYFKCQRDEPKKVTIRYDLSLPSLAEGPVTISQRRTHIFQNPSSEFRRKLLDGGCVSINSNDERNRDINDDRQQQHQLIGKPKLSSNSSSSGSSSDKKHKIKSTVDDLKPSSTFDNLFGTPIMKISNTKLSPEQIKINSSNSNNIKSSSSSSKSSQKNSNAAPSASITSIMMSNDKLSKDKSDKSMKEKKDKNKFNSPLKKSSSKESLSRKSDNSDRHDRREEKRKDKNHKERERSKDKSSKRPTSPKSSRSPKRSISPTSRSNSSNRPPEPSTKYDENKNGSSSSSKKSKKDKRSDKEHDRGGNDPKKDKDIKQSTSSLASSSVTTTSTTTTTSKQKDDKTTMKIIEKLNGTSKREKDSGSGNSTPKESKLNNKYNKTYDGRVDSPHESTTKHFTSSNSDVKKSNDKYDKSDSDRKHKHKKKDKNKDKDKDKVRSGSKEHKKDKEKFTKGAVKELIGDSNQKRLVQTPPIPIATDYPVNSGTKIKPSTIQHNYGSEESSSEFDNDHIQRGTTSSPSIQRPHSSNATRNDLNDLPINDNHLDVLTKKSPSIARNPINSMSNSPSTKSTKKSSKELKNSPTDLTTKDDKKRKRKNKLDKKKMDTNTNNGSIKRKTLSPMVNEPPNKYSRKDELIAQCSGRSSQTPPKIAFENLQMPPTGHQLNDSQTTINSSSTSITLPNLPNDTLQSFRSTHGNDQLANDYLSQLRTLQHKIMSLQGNREMQQVVDMIAATGCYEITSQTFDFDLCALDRSTVQRLQEFLSQSAVL